LNVGCGFKMATTQARFTWRSSRSGMHEREPGAAHHDHHDKGADWTTNSYFYNKLVARNVPFDVIGYSYYPKYDYDSTAGAGSIAELRCGACRRRSHANNHRRMA
jgi:arabinogalactan endo-1,4-beta-galactosidase